MAKKEYVLVPFRGIVVINPYASEPSVYAGCSPFCGAKSFFLKSPPNFSKKHEKIQYLCSAAQKYEKKSKRYTADKSLNVSN